mmetsp:Transcript_24304/g.83076  ORF Transcript_24304/g.83076 Transcript_24304/m.83076 type:complete len:283 (-) Transcript_24304:272-1120(-)
MQPRLVAAVSPSDRLMERPGPWSGSARFHTRNGRVVSGGPSDRGSPWQHTAPSPSSRCLSPGVSGLWSHVSSVVTNAPAAPREASTARESPAHPTTRLPPVPSSATTAVEPLRLTSTSGSAASSASARTNASMSAASGACGNRHDAARSCGTEQPSRWATAAPFAPWPSKTAASATPGASSSRSTAWSWHALGTRRLRLGSGWYPLHTASSPPRWNALPALTFWRMTLAWKGKPKPCACSGSPAHPSGAATTLLDRRHTGADRSRSRLSSDCSSDTSCGGTT